MALPPPRVTPPPPLLDLPVPEVARRVTRTQVDRWIEQSARLGQPEDPEALHDYRTAVRRLRSLIRYFQPWLPGLPRSSRRRLRRLMRLTGQSRNLEVLMHWIRTHQDGLPARQAPGARWLSERVAQQAGHADELMLGRVTRKASRLQARLKAGLRKGRSTRTRTAGTPRAGPVVRRLVRRETAILARRLGAIHALANRTEIHSARIAAKRIRYLLEPFERELVGGTLILERLRDLQDLFGAVTDIHAAADELRDALIVAGAGRAARLGQDLLPWPSAHAAGPSGPPPPRNAQSGLLALARELRREGDASFARLQAWISGTWIEVERMLERAGRISSRGGRI